MTNWMASVYNKEAFVNMTDMIVVKQISGGVESAKVRQSIGQLDVEELLLCRRALCSYVLHLNRFADQCGSERLTLSLVPASIPGASLPHVAGGREGLQRRPRQRLRRADRHGRPQLQGPGQRSIPQGAPFGGPSVPASPDPT